jgi:hypothetical protein
MGKYKNYMADFELHDVLFYEKMESEPQHKSIHLIPSEIKEEKDAVMNTKMICQVCSVQKAENIL